MADIITIPDDPNVFVHDINLDLHDEGYVEEVPLVQYDANKVYVRATIWNNGVRYSVPSTSIIALVATKPDNNGLFNQAGIDSEGRIIYKVTDETTSMYGNFDAQFRLYDTELVDGASVSRLKSSFKFRVYVAKSTLDDNTIISASEFNILTNLINSIGDLTNDVNDAAARANVAILSAETATTKANTATANANTATTNANDAANLANEKAGLAVTATTNAVTATNNANLATENANTATSNANTATTNANNAASNANDKAVLANMAATNANDVATQLETETLKIFKPAVATYSDLLTTYPNPENGWTVTVNGESPVVSYRYNGIEWVNLGIISSVDIATNHSLGIVRGGGNISVDIDGEINTTDISDTTVSFTEVDEDMDIESGENTSIIFGKLLKSIKTLRYNNNFTDKNDKKYHIKLKNIGGRPYITYEEV